jgi:hypothetical protein
VSEDQCAPGLVLALFWAAVSAAAMLDSISHNRKARAWLWAASFAGTLLLGAYCFGRLLVWEEA